MPEATVPAYPHADVVREYLAFLREHRGVSDKHIQRTQHCCASFMTFLATHDVADLTSIPPQLIHRFIVREGNHYHRVTMSTRCGALRRFLGHLYRRSLTSVDLSSVVVAPVVFQQEQCPRFLTRVEVEAVLAVVDQVSPRGRRDYAMMLMLAVYGLRGIEVIRLRLDDIDWRNQKLHIGKRKAGNRTTYPLSVPVGEAIVRYLRDGRPSSQHREVFLTLRPPFSPFADSTTLCSHVSGYLTKAGIHVNRPGMHTFRYSCAQRLLEKGEPLKTIGDFLGHTDPDSTRRYTMIAIDQLREVAIGDGEDML
jgi:site-specific recombinase XerD